MTTHKKMQLKIVSHAHLRDIDTKEVPNQCGK